MKDKGELELLKEKNKILTESLKAKERYCSPYGNCRDCGDPLNKNESGVNRLCWMCKEDYI